MRKSAEIITKALKDKLSVADANMIVTEFTKSDQTGISSGIKIGSAGGGASVVGGFIAGWNLGFDGLYSDDRMVRLVPSPNPEIALGASGYRLGKGFWVGEDNNEYKLFVGEASGDNMYYDGEDLVITGNITADGGSIGGWTITTTEIKKTGIILDSSTDSIAVGSSIAILGAGDGHIDVGSIDIDGSGYIQSSNYESGVSGWHIGEGGFAEFGDVRIRGTLASAVFEVNQIHTTGGTLAVTEKVSSLGQQISFGSDTYIYINNDASVSARYDTCSFNVGDIIRIKALASGDGTPKDTWATLSGTKTDMGDGTHRFEFTNKQGNTGAGYPIGVAVVGYSSSGGGVVYISADDAVGASANMSIVEHTSTPWNDDTDGSPLRVRIGNMYGSYGAGSNNRYGFGVGDYSGGNYLSYNAENEGSFILSGSEGSVKINDQGLGLYDGTLNIYDGSYRAGSLYFSEWEISEDPQIRLELNYSTGEKLSNTSWETGTTGWTITSGGGYTPTYGRLESVTAKDGDWVYMIYCDFEMGVDDGWVKVRTSSYYSCSAGDLVTWSAWVKRLLVDNYFSRLYIEFYNSSYTLLDTKWLNFTAPYFSWGQYIQNEVAPTNTAWVKVGLYCASTCVTLGEATYIYFDLMSLEIGNVYSPLTIREGHVIAQAFSTADKNPGAGNLFIGSNFTDETTAPGRIFFKCYDTAGLGMFAGVFANTDASSNSLYLGGGTSMGYAATSVYVHTASTGTTVNETTGVRRMQIYGTANGALCRIGLSDEDRGIIEMYGLGTGETWGGEARWHLAADHDSSIAYYRILAKSDDLSFEDNGGNEWMRLTGEGNILVENDIYNSAWGTWSPTKVGWGSEQCYSYYKRIGKLIFLILNIVGTSNSGTTTITLPTAISSNPTWGIHAPCKVNSNGTYRMSFCYIAPGSNLATFYADMTGASFGSTGAKDIYLQLTYEANT